MNLQEYLVLSAERILTHGLKRRAICTELCTSFYGIVVEGDIADLEYQRLSEFYEEDFFYQIYEIYHKEENLPVDMGYLGPPRELTEDRKHYLNWIISNAERLTCLPTN